MGKGSVERVSAHGLRELPGVVAVSVGNSRRCFREIHDGYVLCAVMRPPEGESRGVIRYRRWSYDVEPGQVLLMEPGEVHVTRSLQGTANFRMLRLAKDALQRLAGVECEELHFKKPFVLNRTLWNRLCTVHASVVAGADAGVVSDGLRALVSSATTLAGSRADRPRDDPVRSEVGRAVALLRARSQERVSLRELSGHAGLTRFRLVQLFSAELGLPPMQYLLEFRLSAARDRLARGASITDAAHEVGFYDHAQFSRLFKRSTGLTPREYRRALRSAK